jgi:hypothetical protein
MRICIRSSTSVALLVGGALHFAGCGTTRSTDTTRTATEQLLISDAIDRAVQSVHLQTLAGQTVFLDDSRLADVVDRNYLVSSLRQHLLANGCSLRDQRDQADFVVEARAGAVGTDRNDLLFGVPSMNVPQIMPLQPVPAAIPEIPIAKRRDQRGIAKIAVFAYHRESGTPVWQSGVAHQESSSNDVWILGAGPFQRGTIYEGTAFAGKAIGNGQQKIGESPVRLPPIELARENVFTPPAKLIERQQVEATQAIAQASSQAPAPAATSPPSTVDPAATNAAASPPATTDIGPPSPAVPVATTPPAVAPSTTAATPEPPSGPTNGQTTKSAYLHAADQSQLPQPRFNSPK